MDWTGEEKDSTDNFTSENSFLIFCDEAVLSLFGKLGEYLSHDKSFLTVGWQPVLRRRIESLFWLWFFLISSHILAFSSIFTSILDFFISFLPSIHDRSCLLLECELFFCLI